VLPRREGSPLGRDRSGPWSGYPARSEEPRGGRRRQPPSWQGSDVLASPVPAGIARLYGSRTRRGCPEADTPGRDAEHSFSARAGFGADDGGPRAVLRGHQLLPDLGAGGSARCRSAHALHGRAGGGEHPRPADVALRAHLGTGEERPGPRHARAAALLPRVRAGECAPTASRPGRGAFRGSLPGGGRGRARAGSGRVLECRSGRRPSATTWYSRAVPSLRPRPSSRLGSAQDVRALRCSVAPRCDVSCGYDSLVARSRLAPGRPGRILADCAPPCRRAFARVAGADDPVRAAPGFSGRAAPVAVRPFDPVILRGHRPGS